MVRKHRVRQIHRKVRSRKDRPSNLVKTTAKTVTDLVAITGTLSIGTLAISKLGEIAKK